MKKILVADDIAEEGVAHLRSLPETAVVVRPGLKESELCSHVVDCDAVVVRSATRITRKVLEAAVQRLKVVGRAGIGVDNVDVEAATELGVVVINTPDANAVSAAELTIAHLLSLCRKLPGADRSVRAGEWKRAHFTGTEVTGKTFGVIGYGNIGRIVAARALGLKMKVVAHDPFVTREVFAEHGVTPLDLEELLAVSDFVSLHCPLVDDTRNLLSRERIARMKAGARLINCARGGLVDELALRDALQSGYLAGAALDVFEKEPPGNSPLFDLPNVEFTPHLGASTAEAQHAVGMEIARLVVAYLDSGEVTTAVNLPRIRSEQAERMRPYLELARRLGRLLARMAGNPLSRMEVSLQGLAAELEARPVATEALVGFLQEHHTRPVNRVNALHVAKRHGISLSESRTAQTHDYVSLIVVTAHAGGETMTLAGTLFDERHPRLVRINNYELEAMLEGHMLFTRHDDRPGVVGALGTLLGNEGVNISRMHLGIAEGSDKAVAAIETATPLSEALMQKVRAIPAVNKALQITL
ncbi:MAG: phosphoglycerate dehydrogenase [Chromatiales bacterium]